MHGFTSFTEGISKFDNGTEDDIILALSSASLAWCDLEIPFCAYMDSRDNLKQFFFLGFIITYISAAEKEKLPPFWLWIMDVPGRIRAACPAFLQVVDLSYRKSVSSIPFPSCLHSRLCLGRQIDKKYAVKDIFV